MEMHQRHTQKMQTLSNDFLLYYSLDFPPFFTVLRTTEMHTKDANAQR